MKSNPDHTPVTMDPPRTAVDWWDTFATAAMLAIVGGVALVILSPIWGGL